MGLFITLEGPDGCGTTTQARLLYERLQIEGISVVHTREPGGTNVRIAEQIRKMLLTKHNKEMFSVTEVFLYFAARAQHVGELIRPNLNQSITVVCERFNDSTLAYQGYGRELNLQILREIAEFAAGGLVPNVTFLLDIEASKGLARKNPHTFDRLEAEKLAFHERVRQGYKTMASGNPRFYIIDAEKPIDEIAEIMWQKVVQLMGGEEEEND